MPRFRLGFHRYGHPWRFRFQRTSYYSGLMTWFSFWRFYFVIDRRHLGES